MAENKLKLIHFADLHARRDNLDKVEKFFEFALQVAEDKEPDIVVIPGDIWDGEVAVNENSPLYMVIRYIRRLAMLQDVYMIPGTPSHDRPGSLNIFKSLHTERQIFVLDRPELFSMCIDIKRKERGNLAVFPIPGVTKSGLMTWAKSRGLDLSPDRADVEAAGLVRELFLGFRAEMARFATRHPEFIPLLLGHFTVYGSETPTGQVMTGGDIVISTTDIREAGAVINCLGHIHKPQQIGENIFYSGSPFPHNWGEKEQKSVLYAEVNRHEILQLERIPTPFPAMVDFDLIYYPEDSDDQPFRFLDKKTGGPAGFPDFNPHGCNQADTRIRLHMPPEAKDLVNEDHIKKWLSWNDLHPNSVKFEKIIKPQSRQRCEVINEAITNLERLKAWAETTETDLAEDIPAKLHKLQSELVLEDDAGLTARGTIRLKSLRLRGSKGITWTDEIKIDFEKFNSDMILFDGDNGAGKSTTFDNLHPYPFSFYYDGLNWNAKLSDHFRLEDSCRELVVSIDGIDYMFLLVVDGVRGKAEYYAYRLDGEDWTTLNDGKKPSYKRVVLELFGSPELFQQGVYQVQGTNGLINKTNAELKDMFYDFLGFTEYQAIAEKAKESAQALQNEISLTEAKLSEDRRALEFIPEFDAELEKQQKAIAEHKANKFLATSELEELEFKLKEREKKAATQESVKKQIADLDQQLEELSTRKIRTQNKFQAWKAKQEMKIGRLYADIQKDKDLIERRDKIEEMVKLSKEAQELKARIEKKEAEISAARRDLRQVESLQASNLKNIEDQIQRTEAEIKQNEELAERLENVPCQQFNAKEFYSGDVQEWRSFTDELIAEVIDLCSKCPLISSAVDASKSLKPLVDNLKDLAKEKQSLEGEHEDKLDSLRKSLSKLEEETEVLRLDYEGFPEKARKTDWGPAKSSLDIALARAEQLADQLKEARESLAYQQGEYDKLIPEFSQQMSGLRAKRDELEKQIDIHLAEEIRECNHDIRIIKSRIESQETRILEAEKAKAAAEAKIKELLELEERIKETEKKHASKKADYSDYVLLQTAFSRNGIPALLLENALPQISSLANDLLSEFGSSWQIRFDTVKDKASGKGQIETLDIIVIDEQGERPIRLLSGGQKVPFIVAMQAAVSIYRAQQSGFEPKFAMVDECDGALRDFRASALFNMLQKRMQLGRLDKLLLVTHRKELADQCEQKIIYDTASGNLKEVY